MSNLAYARVQSHLERLKLPRMAECLDTIAQQAAKESDTYMDFRVPAGGRGFGALRARCGHEDQTGSLSLSRDAGRVRICLSALDQ